MHLQAKQNITVRARANAIQKLSRMYPEYSKAILWGTIPKETLADYEQLEKEELQELRKNKENNAPLSFTELTSFNTWFYLYKDKVAGTEALTTSLLFPVTIKGTRKDVEQLFARALGPQKAKAKNEKAESGDPMQKPVRFYFNASNIYVYDAASGDILAHGEHNSKNLLFFLEEYPNFQDRLDMHYRLSNYYGDVPKEKRLWHFKDDLEKTKNFPGNRVLEFSDPEKVKEYMDKFGDWQKSPISRTMIYLKSGEAYFWENRQEWESKTSPSPIIYRKQEDKSDRLRIVKAEAMVKLKLIKLLKL